MCNGAANSEPPSNEDIALHSSPIVKILEHMEVQGTEVGEIEGTGYSAHIKQPGENQKPFGSIQLLLVPQL